MLFVIKNNYVCIVILKRIAMKTKRTYEDFINIILKPIFHTTTDEIKWVLKKKEWSEPYKVVYKNELKKRKQRELVLA